MDAEFRKKVQNDLKEICNAMSDTVVCGPAVDYHITDRMCYAVYWDNDGTLQVVSNTDNL